MSFPCKAWRFWRKCSSAPQLRYVSSRVLHILLTRLTAEVACGMVMVITVPTNLWHLPVSYRSSLYHDIIEQEHQQVNQWVQQWAFQFPWTNPFCVFFEKQILSFLKWQLLCQGNILAKVSNPDISRYLPYGFGIRIHNIKHYQPFFLRHICNSCIFSIVLVIPVLVYISGMG